MESIDEADRDRKIGLHNSTNKMLMRVTESGEDELKMEERRTVLDLWVVLVRIALELDKDFADKLFVPDREELFLVTGNKYPDH